MDTHNPAHPHPITSLDPQNLWKVQALIQSLYIAMLQHMCIAYTHTHTHTYSEKSTYICLWYIYINTHTHTPTHTQTHTHTHWKVNDFSEYSPTQIDQIKDVCWLAGLAALAGWLAALASVAALDGWLRWRLASWLAGVAPRAFILGPVGPWAYSCPVQVSIHMYIYTCKTIPYTTISFLFQV